MVSACESIAGRDIGDGERRRDPRKGEPRDRREDERQRGRTTEKQGDTEGCRDWKAERQRHRETNRQRRWVGDRKSGSEIVIQ